jgi:hypothetical protein
MWMDWTWQLKVPYQTEVSRRGKIRTATTCRTGAYSSKLLAADGFESIFDGTLKNWDGDPVHW